MRYVQVEEADGGFFLNPDPYLEALPGFAAELPPGARAFAEDAEHYNIFKPRCVKDLELERLTVRDREARVSIEIEYAPNRFKHDNGLVVRYTNVTAFDLGVTAGSRTENVWPDARRLDDLQLDEILPHPDGCSHEIKFVGGRVWVVAEDLTASWTGPPPAPDA